ncbi:cell wall-active antibiotics response protein LiaF [Mesobacillus jeotgali]|uniref:cell wall-active antibiotics response protein LiaF n=1 Tax=Mesobacillus jeotgali TaxID=129985 RepID=UPI002147FE34|nr:cell wall-active antibiotics response protein LiaF [Mesobacillus jeotgali]
MLRTRSVNQIAVAIILAGLGIILLLVNLGVISWEIKELFVVTYPFLLLMYGLVTLLKKQFGWGLFIGVFSSLLVMDRFDVMAFRFLDVWKLWPLLLIYVGVTILTGKRKINVIYQPDQTSGKQEERFPESNGNSMRKIRGASIGKVTFKEQNWAVEPMDLYNMVGEYFIDFSKGFIPDRETPIRVRGWVGEVKMLIPEGVPVKVNAVIGVGEVKLFDYAQEQIKHVIAYKSDDYDAAVRKLNITIELKIGSVRVDRV